MKPTVASSFQCGKKALQEIGIRGRSFMSCKGEVIIAFKSCGGNVNSFSKRPYLSSQISQTFSFSVW